MPDREKVIKALEYCRNQAGCWSDESECPWIAECREDVNSLKDATLALLKDQEESIPLKPLCKWLAGYAAPPGNASWLALYGSLEKAWEHELKELFTS